MPKHGKNFRKAVESCDVQERYSVEDAVSKSLGAAFAKFDETVWTPSIPIRWCAAP